MMGSWSPEQLELNSDIDVEKFITEIALEDRSLEIIALITQKKNKWFDE